MSARKPHNDLAGYVCERKSHHPKLPGYFIIFDRDKGGDWVTGTDGSRWGLLHSKPNNTSGCVVCFSNLPTARAIMKDMCAGSDIADFGQHEEAQP